MTVNYHSDSDGVRHAVMEQQQAMSCAVASIWMARCLAKRMTVREDEWGLAWRMYHQVVRGLVEPPVAPAPMTFNPDMHREDSSTFGNMFSRYGTAMSEVVAAMRNDGVNTSHLTNFRPGTALDPGRLTEGKPAIILLGWYRGAERDGGHFIVAARKSSVGRIVYLDPGGWMLESTAGPVYNGSGRFEQIAYLHAH